MNHYRPGPPSRRWEPKLPPLFVRLTSRIRKRITRRLHRVMKVHVHHSDRIQESINAGHGVLVTPNHSSHCDPHAIYDAADAIVSPLFIMATWHVFDVQKWHVQWMLQKIGCFSVDRDGADLNFRMFDHGLEKLHSLEYLTPKAQLDHSTLPRHAAAAMHVWLWCIYGQDDEGLESLKLSHSSNHWVFARIFATVQAHQGEFELAVAALEKYLRNGRVPMEFRDEIRSQIRSYRDGKWWAPENAAKPFYQKVKLPIAAARLPVAGTLRH